MDDEERRWFLIGERAEREMRACVQQVRDELENAMRSKSAAAIKVTYDALAAELDRLIDHHGRNLRGPEIAIARPVLEHFVSECAAALRDAAMIAGGPRIRRVVDLANELSDVLAMRIAEALGDPVDPSRKQFNTAAEVEAWYEARLRQALADGVRYSREEDQRAGRAVGLGRDRVRELRKRFAPDWWSEPGAPLKGKD